MVDTPPPTLDLFPVYVVISNDHSPVVHHRHVAQTSLRPCRPALAIVPSPPPPQSFSALPSFTFVRSRRWFGDLRTLGYATAPGPPTGRPSSEFVTACVSWPTATRRRQRLG